MSRFVFALVSIFAGSLLGGFIMAFYFFGMKVVNVDALVRQYLISLFVIFCISLYSLFRKS